MLSARIAQNSLRQIIYQGPNLSSGRIGLSAFQDLMVILNLTQTCWAYRSNPMAFQTALLGDLAPKFSNAEIKIAANIDQNNITFSLQ